MATIDDVYNYITSPTQGFPAVLAILNVMQAHIGSPTYYTSIVDYLDKWFEHPGGHENLADIIFGTNAMVADLENNYDVAFPDDPEGDVKIDALWRILHRNVDDGTAP